MSPGGNGLFMEPARHSNPAVPASVLHATEDSITTPPAVMARPGSMMTWAEAGAAPIITMRAPASTTQSCASCVSAFSMATLTEMLLPSITAEGDELAMNLERILFTRVRGMGILGSSYLRSCIAPVLYSRLSYVACRGFID